MSGYEEKKKQLHDRMESFAKRDIAVAFSGGVDSSLLLKIAVEHAKKNQHVVYALTANTELHPQCDLEIAEKLAKDFGAEHIVLEIRELECADILDNPEDRCYRCKKYLFQTMLKTIENRNVDTILEGTNADDKKVYRPGIRAIQELGLKSPLLETGFTKEEVRRMAGEYHIAVSSRPSTPCLATRFPYGRRLSMEKLKQVEKGEAYLKTLGFYNLRLRVHNDIARIEVDSGQMTLALEHREQIITHLKELGYPYVTLDLEGFRSGSMDYRIGDK